MKKPPANVLRGRRVRLLSSMLAPCHGGFARPSDFIQQNLLFR
jgi:hypothetical protein